MVRGMDELTLGLLGRPFFTRAEALDSGWSDRSLAAAVRRAVPASDLSWLLRPLEVWEHVDRPERYHLRCQVALHSLGPAVALSHVSALVMHGMATWGVPLDRSTSPVWTAGPVAPRPAVVHHERPCRAR